MSPHYLVKSSKFSLFYILFTRIEYQSTIRTSCGSVLLRHGLNFNTAWWTMQLISGEKDWKHVSVQKVVTLNICCNVACLTFHLPQITTSSSQSHQCQPTTGFFQIHQRLEECNIPSVTSVSSQHLHSATGLNYIVATTTNNFELFLLPVGKYETV